MSVEDVSTDGGLALIASVGIGIGTEFGGMTVMESCRVGELVDSKCKTSSKSSKLLNNLEDLTVRWVSMNSVS